MPIPLATPYFRPLTGIRAVAAYFVFAHHYLNRVSPVVNELHIGVTIFFTLSGLLITLRYLDQAHLSRTWLGRYFLNRVARIYPTYLLLTGLAFFFVWQQAGAWAGNGWPLLLNLTFLRGFSETYLCTGVAQGWSLTVEETFYALAPLWLVALGWAATARRQAALLVGLVLGSGALGAVFTLLLHGAPDGFFSDFNFLFGYTFFGRATEFAVGAGLALVLRRPGAAQAAARSWGRTGVGLAGMALVLLALAGVKHHYDLAFGTAHWQGLVLNNAVLPFFIAALFYGLITERTALARFLGSAPMQVLGRSSYCFYLLHLGYLPQRVFLTLPGVVGWPYPVQILALFGLVLLASVGLYYGVEEPLNRAIRRWAHPRPLPAWKVRVTV